MRTTWALVICVVSGCAHDAADLEPAVCCSETAAASAPVPDERVDFVGRVDGPESCEKAARARLAVSPDEGWRQLWGCVWKGHFTALRSLLQGAWDHELQTRPDAPWLVARVIAERGGDVDDDLRLIHERRVPLFGLAQVLARPDLYRHAIVIVRARLSPSGVLTETRLVSQTWNVPLTPSERVVTRATAPFASDSRRFYESPRAYNLDVATGTRVIGLVEQDPFVDADDAVVVLGRFDGLRDGDAWPVVSVLGHFRPGATVAY